MSNHVPIFVVLVFALSLIPISINSASAETVSLSVTINDTLPPSITLNGPNPQTVQLGVQYQEHSAVLTDNDPNYSGTISVSSAVDHNALGTYTVTYSAPSDAVGNVPVPVTRTVIVYDNSKNLLNNASFEDVTSYGTWMVYENTTDSLEWDISWRDGTCGNRSPGLELQRGILGGAYSGTQHAELDSYCPVIISQSIPTILGESYDVTFASKKRPNTIHNSNGLQVTADGNILGTISTMSDSWSTTTYSFTASSGNTTVSFADTGISDSRGTFLDDISITKTGDTANVIADGSFENMPVAKRWTTFDGTTQNIGWDISWNTNNPHLTQDSLCPGVPLLEVQHGILGGASAGVQHAELDSDCTAQKKTPVMLSQSVTTEPGTSYDVTFASKKRPGTTDNSNALQVIVNNSTLGTIHTMTDSWSTTTYSFVANSSNTVISFADIGRPDGRGTLLDDIIVNKNDNSTNLVSNGSFEGVVMNKSWQTFDSDEISSWDVSWNESNPYVTSNVNYYTCPSDGLVEIQKGLLGGAYEGDNHAELDSHCYGKFHTPVIISQDITTMPGTPYELSWYSKARPNTSSTTNGLAVSVDGIPVNTISTMNNEWTKHSYSFVAASNSTAISFADIGIPNSYGTFVDDISLHIPGRN